LFEKDCGLFYFVTHDDGLVENRSAKQFSRVALQAYLEKPCLAHCFVISYCFLRMLPLNTI